MTVSELGAQVSQLALPLTAISTLRTGSLAVGVLRTLETLPFVLIGLPAGAWVERRRRRPVMIGADVLRAVVLASVPLAFALGDLTLLQLYLAALVAGTGTVLFDVAYQSFLPQLVDRDQLLDANAKLGVSQSVAQVGGPGVAGVLVRALGAPGAVAAYGAGFVLSATGITAIRHREATPPPRQDGASIVADVRSGLRYLLGHRLLGYLAGCTATANLGLALIDTVLVVFLARSIHLGPGRIGLVFALGGTGVVAGALVAARAGRRLGMGPACLLGIGVAGGGALVAPLAPGRPAGMWVVVASQWLVMFGGTIYNVTQVALRQAVCPDDMRSRMIATTRFLIYGTLSVGDLLGGLLGSALGLRSALWVGAGFGIVSLAWLLAEPVRHLRAMPPQDRPADAAPGGVPRGVPGSLAGGGRPR